MISKVFSCNFRCIACRCLLTKGLKALSTLKSNVFQNSQVSFHLDHLGRIAMISTFTPAHCLWTTSANIQNADSISFHGESLTLTNQCPLNYVQSTCQFVSSSFFCFFRIKCMPCWLVG